MAGDGLCQFAAGWVKISTLRREGAKDAEAICGIHVGAALAANI
jgi:hypothetical protein